MSEQLVLDGMEPAKQRRRRKPVNTALPTVEDAAALRQWVLGETTRPGALAKIMEVNGITGPAMLAFQKDCYRKFTITPAERRKLLALADRWEAAAEEREAADG